MSTKNLIALTLCTFLLMPFAQSQATTLTVSPTLIELNADGQAATVTVKNTDNNATTLQVLAKSWERSESQIPHATEIFAVPPIFDLPPGGEQTIRLAARGLDGIVAEKAYLFYVKEVPGELQVDRSALAFALSLELPLFVRPENAKPEPVWEISRSPDGDAVINLTNTGNAHFRVDRFKVTAGDDSGLIAENTAGAYVLAGTARYWPLDSDIAALKGPVTLDAETSLGPIQTVILPPDS
ncbi:MAG: fimbria/pilus periplasmic chaperone [Pseudomonadota bacterium]